MRVCRSGLAALAFGAAIMPASATVYSCGNANFEIACTAESCASSDGFTAMSVTLDTRRRRLEACAYSGCWSGRTGAIQRAGPLLIAIGTRLRSPGPGQSPGPAVLVVDTTTRGATINAFGFQNPATCTATSR